LKKFLEERLAFLGVNAALYLYLVVQG
jgi:hypothetical protein